MDFEWDDAKHEQAVRDRGFGFDVAAMIFLGPTLEKIDNRKVYGEVRVRATGSFGGNVYTVVYTDRETGRRIISARKAKRKERMQWHGSL